MKLNWLNIALFCTVLMAGTTFTACSDDYAFLSGDKADDGENETIVPVDENLVGNYKGFVSYEESTEVPSFENGGVPKRLNLTNTGDSAMGLDFVGVSVAGKDKDIKLSGIKLNKIGENAYSFNKSENIFLTDTGSDGTDGVSVPTPVSVKGTIVDGNISIKMGVFVLSQFSNQIINYAGTHLTGKENSEAKILSFSFDANENIAEQPVINADNTIKFIVTDRASDDFLSSLIPHIEISKGAAISPATDVPQDFSKGKVVTYTVVAEDGTVEQYQASVAAVQSILEYGFEEWTSVSGSWLSNAYEKPQPTNELATSSEGAAKLKLYGLTSVPTRKTEDSKNGKYAIELQTLDTSAKASSLIPAITSGSVYTGRFNLDINDKLNSTKFGIPYEKEPVLFKGWYKYTPGSKYLDGSDYKNIKELIDVTDECAIQAVLYEAVDDNGNDITLTGHDINSSEHRVAVARLADGTAKSEWTSFSLKFVFLNGKTYDKAKKYKLAIVCSSSKDGDFYKGAGGSTLLLDNLEVIGQ